MPEIKLKPKTFRIFYRLYQGKTDNEIAKELDISYHTVKNHKTKLYELLNINRRSQIPEMLKQFKITLDYLIV